MTYSELKQKIPVAAALLRRQMPRSFHGCMQYLQFWEQDGDLYADDESIIPETLVLPACSRTWIWESEK